MSSKELTFDELCMQLNEGKIKDIEPLLEKNNEWITKTDSVNKLNIIFS